VWLLWDIESVGHFDGGTHHEHDGGTHHEHDGGHMH
jgi:hypothetical protein